MTFSLRCFVAFIVIGSSIAQARGQKYAATEVYRGTPPAVSTNFRARPTKTTDASYRMDNRHGIGIGVFDPALLNISYNFNATDFMRFSAGTGMTLGSDTNLAAVRVGTSFFVPKWYFSPTVGVQYVHTKFQNQTMDMVGGLRNGNNWLINAGVDLQNARGFQFGAGASIRYGNKFPVPYLQLGLFF